MASNGVHNNTFLNRRDLFTASSVSASTSASAIISHGLSAGTGRPPSHVGKAQSTIEDLENSIIFKKPTLGVPPAPPALKRKLSKNDINTNNKVYLRRLSGSSSGDMNSANNRGLTTGPPNRAATMGATPLSEKPQSLVDHDINTANVPVLVLAPFEASPWLEFGKVLIGTKRTLALVVENPTDVTEKLILDPNCKMDEKGFNISQLDPLHTGAGNGSVEPIMLPPRSKTEISICWTPLSVGSIRAGAMLRTNSGRFMVNLRGHGEVLVCACPFL